MKSIGGKQGEKDGPLARNTTPDDRFFVKWLEKQPETTQTELALLQLSELLYKAAQPRHASGNACVKLCYFMEQCRNSDVSHIREFAFSEKSCLDLFNFYIEWNEKNQHRSMRLVLDLLASLISLHPDQKTSFSVKQSILQRVISIITHQSAQPLVKPAFKLLECFLGKGTISPDALISYYEDQSSSNNASTSMSMDRVSSWDSFISGVFEWLTLPDISPAGGKFLVTLFGEMRNAPGEAQNAMTDHTILWQRWIRNGLSKNPEALENVKNYLFPPLFKLDRPGSLAFLGDLNKQGPISGLQIQDLNAHSLLQLAAIEVGKKSGLVEEPSTIQFQKDPKKSAKCVILEEASIGGLLTHASNTVRSLAFSVLVSSSSPIRPFSPEALNLFQEHMAALYADTDAKFRNDILTSTKQMIERVRGSTAYLVRELDNISFIPVLDNSEQPSPEQNGQETSDATKDLLTRHEKFIEWYLEFLSAELIPTASYQRHITALKAISILLRSGILESGSKSPSRQILDNSTIWPYTTKFFTSGLMRLTLDLLLDPFEDVRSNAAVVLKFASPNDFTSREENIQPVENTKPTLSRSQEAVDLDARTLVNDLQRHQNHIHVTNMKTRARPLGLLFDFLDRAKSGSKRTGRADYADGVARSYEIIFSLTTSTNARLAFITDLVDELDLKVGIAEKDLAQAVFEAPIHSDFAALSFVWDSIDRKHAFQNLTSQVELDEHEQWNGLQVRMLHSCVRIWNVVKDVLCNDSPEGHLPNDLDEVETVDTKDVLSYSFRAIHESSNLMRTMVSKIKSRWEDGFPILPAEVFIGNGDLTFEQLSSLRHRGAFSTVSLTFARCCQLTQHHVSDDFSHQNLLEKWYEGALKCISEQASTTRRSAGIPSLIAGILSANAEKPAFQDVMAELKILSRRPAKLSVVDETNLPQVHAMNCLKEIFKSSTLGRRSESHIAECLQIAADSLNSEIWAIRNCGLLLLRSLIDCLFGTHESKDLTEAGWDGRSIKLSYDKYPALPELLLKLLDTDTSISETLKAPEISAVESMFPALDIVRRAGPPDTRRNDIYKCVSLHLGSRVWHVRELAARTICTLLLHDNWLPAVVQLIETSSSSTNRVHGVLMAVKFVLERRLALDPNSATDGLNSLASLLKSFKMWSFFESGSPEIMAAYLEVSNTIAKILLSAQNSNGGILINPDFDSIVDHLFLHDAYEEFSDLMRTYPTLTASIGGCECSVSTALASNAVVHRAIYTAALRSDTLSLRKIVILSATLDTDVVLAALECIPNAWSNHSSPDMLFGLSKAYIGAIENTQSPEVRSTATFELAEVLDRQSGRFDSSNANPSQQELAPKIGQHQSLDLNEMIRGEIKDLGSLLQAGTNAPSLSNAEVRISGSLLLCEYLSQKHFNRIVDTYKPRMEAWGKMLVEAGDSSNDFETRYAAAAALASFYNNPCFEWCIPSDECMLSSIFALYDTLNDDDDEIRDLSAETVSALLRKSLVPLAARIELAQYISRMHARTRSFAWNVVSRMTGSKLETVDSIRFRLQPVRAKLSQAMTANNSLFVEEEQNLFIDEVREAKLWSKVFEETALDPWSDQGKDFDPENAWAQPHSALAAWVMDGLLALNALSVRKDGPLGWTSKPIVFALSASILLSANAIIKFHEGPLTSATGRPVPGNRTIGGIIFGLEEFVTLSQDQKIHESLLVGIQRNPLLPRNNLQRVVPIASNLLKKKALFASA